MVKKRLISLFVQRKSVLHGSMSPRRTKSLTTHSCFLGSKDSYKEHTTPFPTKPEMIQRGLEALSIVPLPTQPYSKKVRKGKKVGLIYATTETWWWIMDFVKKKKTFLNMSFIRVWGWGYCICYIFPFCQRRSQVSSMTNGKIANLH